MSFSNPGSLPRIPGRGKPVPGVYLGSNLYTSTQTLIIPRWATKGFFRMCGASGGVRSTGALNSAASAGGSYAEKLLTGLSAGLTLALTIGAAGSASPGAGGNTILASGTQSIVTVTAFGSAAANTVIGSPGSLPTGADFAIQGGYGITGSDTSLGIVFVLGGSNPLGFGAATSGNVDSGVTGLNYGGGSVVPSANSGTHTNVGVQGVCLADWFA